MIASTLSPRWQGNFVRCSSPSASTVVSTRTAFIGASLDLGTDIVTDGVPTGRAGKSCASFFTGVDSPTPLSLLLGRARLKEYQVDYGWAFLPDNRFGPPTPFLPEEVAV
jgi:hypothetical protein